MKLDSAVFITTDFDCQRTPRPKIYHSSSRSVCLPTDNRGYRAWI